MRSLLARARPRALSGANLTAPHFLPHASPTLRRAAASYNLQRVQDVKTHVAMLKTTNEQTRAALEEVDPDELEELQDVAFDLNADAAELNEVLNTDYSGVQVDDSAFEAEWAECGTGEMNFPAATADAGWSSSGAAAGGTPASAWDAGGAYSGAASVPSAAASYAAPRAQEAYLAPPRAMNSATEY